MTEATLDPKGLEAAARRLAEGNEAWAAFVAPSDDLWHEFLPEATAAITAYLAAIENPAPVEED